MEEELYLEAYGRNTTVNALIIRRRAKRRNLTISHRAFQPEGKIKRATWWFGDKEFRLVSPEQGVGDQEAIIWLDTKV